MRKSEFLLQKTDGGQIGLCVGLFFLLYLAVLLSGQLQLEQIRSSGSYLEDALAASGLASALVDVKEYGSTHVVRIANEEGAYERYCRSLCANLNLDQNWECPNKRMISGRVTVENYTIYQVRGEEVTSIRLDNGRKETVTGRLGQVYAPNGICVERTGIYSEVSYTLRGLFGMTVPARKGKLVDIVGRD